MSANPYPKGFFEQDANTRKVQSIRDETSAMFDSKGNRTYYGSLDKEGRERLKAKIQARGAVDVAVKAMGGNLNYALQITEGVSPDRARSIVDATKRSIANKEAVGVAPDEWSEVTRNQEIIKDLIHFDKKRGDFSHPEVVKFFLRDTLHPKAYFDDIDHYKEIEKFQADTGSFTDKFLYNVESATISTLKGLGKAGAGLLEVATGTNTDFSSFNQDEMLPLDNQGIWEQSGALVPWIVAGLTGTAMPIMGASVGGDTYGNLREEGVGKIGSLVGGILSGAGEAYLENIKLKHFGEILGSESQLAKYSEKKLIKSMGSMFDFATHEMLPEALQNVKTAMVEESIKVLAEKTTLDKAFNNVVDSVGQGIDEAKVMGVLFPFAMAGKLVGYHRIAKRHGELADFFNKAMNSIARSKYKKGTTEFFDEQAKKQGIDSANITAEDIKKHFFQSEDESGLTDDEKIKKQADVDAFKKAMDISEDEWNNSLKAGTKLEFDVKKWAEVTNGTEFGLSAMQDISFTQDGLTQSEIDTMDKNIQKDIEKSFKKLQKDLGRLTFAKQELDLVKPLRDKLLKSNKNKQGKYNAKEADAITQLYLSMAKNNSAGLSVEEYIKQNPLRVEYITSDKLNEKLGTNKAGVKGASYTDSLGKVISLTEKADFSTVTHEMFHLFLDDMLKAENTSTKVNSMLDSMEAFAGDLTKTENVERLAKAWESYLQEGNAPSSRLINAFGEFSKFSKGIFRVLRKSGVNPSAEVSNVFDKMIASEEEINAIADYYAEQSFIDNYLQNGFSKMVADKEGNVSLSKASEMLFSKYMSEYNKLRSDKIQPKFEKLAKEIIDKDKFYKSIDKITAEGGINEADLYEIVGDELPKVAYKFKDLVKEDGLPVTEILYNSAFEKSEYSNVFSSEEELGNLLVNSKSKDEAIADKVVRMQKVFEERNTKDSGDIAYHNNERLKSLNSTLIALQRDLELNKTKDILGEDYDIYKSHEDILENGTEIQKLVHLANIMKESDKLDAFLEEYKPSKKEIDDKYNELKKTPIALYLDIREEVARLSDSKNRLDWKWHKPNDTVGKKYHSSKGISIYDIEDTKLTSLGGKSLKQAEIDGDISIDPLEAIMEAYTKEDYLDSKTISSLRKELRDTATNLLIEEHNSQYTGERDDLLNNEMDVKYSLGLDKNANYNDVVKAGGKKLNITPNDIKIDKNFYKAVKISAKNHLMYDVGLKDAISVSRYTTAEKSCMTKAVAEIQKGNLVGAIDRVKQAMLNNALAMEAYKLKYQNEEMDKFFRTRNMKKSLEKVELAYADSVIALLKGYGLNVDSKLEMYAKTPAEAFSQLGSNVDIDKSNVETVNRLREIYNPIPLPMQAFEVSLDEMTMADKEEIYNTIKGLMKLGRGALYAKYDAKVKTIEEARDAIIEGMSVLPDRYTKPGEADELKGRIKNWLKTRFSDAQQFVFIAQAIDGFAFIKKKGVGLMQQFEHRGQQADVEFKERQGIAMEDIASVIEPLGKDEAKLNAKYIKSDSKADNIASRTVNRKILYGLEKEIPVTNYMRHKGQLWTFDRLVSVLLNSGSQQNLDALMNEGNGLTIDNIQKIASLFSKESLESIDKVWEVEGRDFDDLDRITFEQTNRHLKKVEALPIEFTSSEGELVRLKGGYHRLFYEASASEKEEGSFEEFLKKNKLKRKMQPHNKAKTGARKSRLVDDEGRLLSQRPLQLTFSTIYRSINESIHDITHSSYLFDMDRLVNDKVFQEAVEEKLGYQAISVIKHALNTMSSTNYKLGEDYIGFASTLDKWRSLAGTSILQFKFAIGLKQRLSTINGLSAMAQGGDNSKSYYMDAVRELGAKANLYGNTEGSIIKNIFDISPYMRVRGGLFDMNASDAERLLHPLPGQVTFNGKKIGLMEVQEFGWSWIRMNDMATVLPLWYASYNQALGENIGMDDSMSETEKVKKAMQYADGIVRTSQPSTLPIDLSKWQTAEAFRQFTSFMTFQMKFGNRIMSAITAYNVGAMTKKDIAKALMVEVFLPRAIQLGFATLMYSDDREPELHEWATTPMFDLLAFIPIVRNVPSMFKYGMQAGVPPVLSVPVKMGMNLLEPKDSTDFIYAVLKSFGYAYGVNPLNAYDEYKATKKRME